MLYLAPELRDRVVALVRALLARRPDTLPYGGEFWPDVVPHLTVTDTADAAEMQAV